MASSMGSQSEAEDEDLAGLIVEAPVAPAEPVEHRQCQFNCTVTNTPVTNAALVATAIAAHQRLLTTTESLPAGEAAPGTQSSTSASATVRKHFCRQQHQDNSVAACHTLWVAVTSRSA